jgi:mycothiol S-conjugate amidase
VTARCLLAVHAHPDDESSKGAATAARYAAEGVRTVLVTCTGGEAGELREPSLADVVRARGLAAVRRAELAAATALLGYASTYELGYRDSGTGSPEPGTFAAAEVEEVSERLVEILRAERADVVVSYAEAYARRHPDHWQCHRATVRAFAAAATPSWRPSKLYLTRTHSSAKVRAMHDWLLAQGRASPYERLLVGPAAGGRDPTTTRIHVADHLAAARAALRAHRSQVPADDPWFFSVPTEVMAALYPWEDFELAVSTVPMVVDESGYEADLFSGLP